MRKFKALAFDVGGSVFNWKDAVKEALEVIIAEQGIRIDVGSFAMEWRKNLFLVMKDVRSGELPQMNIDAMFALALGRIAPGFPELKLTDRAKSRLLSSWHRMKAWDDFPLALERLKEKYNVMVLTILSFAIVVNSSKASGITWDGIISCEFLKHYKPDPRAYQEACSLMGLRPEEVCMVAVHPSDLLAAKQAGMGTAYSAPQLDEPDVPGMTLQELPPPEAYDYYADSFKELVDMMC